MSVAEGIAMPSDIFGFSSSSSIAMLSGTKFSSELVSSLLDRRIVAEASNL